MLYTSFSQSSAVLLLLVAAAHATAVTTTATYQSTITSDANGPLDLTMELNYDSARTNAPIAVVMHQFSGMSGNFQAYRANAQRLRDQGFFVLTVAMRGRDGSDGVRDSGGLEIYDIYDAVEHVKAQYATAVDPTNISITGYSGGGGNVFSAITKFPDYFRAASSFFGMSDYGYNAAAGWYNNGASSSHRTILNADIGNPNTGGAAVRDRYLARASNLAAINNPYAEIHLFVNGSGETTCPPVNDTSYQNNALAAASYAGEFDNITVHLGQAGTYYDFNGDSINDASEQQYWPHQAPPAEQQAAAEQWYLHRLLTGQIARPVLHASDRLFVAGFVKTSAFEAWLGDGQNAAGMLDYQLAPGRFQFDLALESSDLTQVGRIDVPLASYAGTPFDVYLNGVWYESFIASETYRFSGLASGESLLIQAVPEPASLGLGVVAASLLLQRRRPGRAS